MSNDFQLHPSWLAAAVLLGLSGAAFAQETTPPEIDVMKRIAEVYDQDGDDRISLDEFREFTRTAWRSMDANGQGAVNKEEFMKWDPGISFRRNRARQGRQLHQAERGHLRLLGQR